MANIELVIKISEDEYNIAKYGQYGNINVDTVRKAITNGTPLPKGHGRIIDENKIKNCGWDFIDHHARTDAPTIIESNEAEYEPPESEEI